MTARELASALGPYRKVGRNYTVRCVAHDDKTPSLDIADGRKGIVMVCRSGGCSQQSIIRVLGEMGLWESGEFVPETPAQKKEKRMARTWRRKRMAHLDHVRAEASKRIAALLDAGRVPSEERQPDGSVRYSMGGITKTCELATREYLELVALADWRTGDIIEMNALLERYRAALAADRKKVIGYIHRGISDEQFLSRLVAFGVLADYYQRIPDAGEIDRLIVDARHRPASNQADTARVQRPEADPTPLSRVFEFLGEKFLGVEFLNLS